MKHVNGAVDYEKHWSEEARLLKPSSLAGKLGVCLFAHFPNLSSLCLPTACMV